MRQGTEALTGVTFFFKESSPPGRDRSSIYNTSNEYCVNAGNVWEEWVPLQAGSYSVYNCMEESDISLITNLLISSLMYLRFLFIKYQ